MRRTEYVTDEELTRVVNALLDDVTLPELQWLRDYAAGFYCAMGVCMDDNGDAWPLKHGPVKIHKLSDMERLFAAELVTFYLVVDYHFWSKADERARRAKLYDYLVALKPPKDYFVAPPNFENLQPIEHKPKDESMDTFVKWTDEEWQAVAKRARAIKDSRPDMSWQQIVPVCQDDITPERRRFTINKLSGLKQMFDILDLDENGNVKPPPPPPPPPTPEPIVPPPVASPSPAPKLSEAPIDALVTEILSRGASMKALAEEVVVTKVVIENSLIAHKEQMEVLSQRVDGMERTVLELDERVMTVLNRCERINLDYTELTKLNTILHEALMACDQEALMKVANQTATGGVQLMQAEMQKGTLTHDGHLNPPKVQRVAPVRFLVVGPLPKDVTRIKERLPRSLNVEIILGENNEQIKLPANIDYCVVSGHADFTRRWQTCRDAYGQSKVHRMENGSIGTFANQIEVLASLHHKQHVKAA